MLICSTFVSNGPLAQLVERGANNLKVLCSRLIRTRFHFLFGLLLFLSRLGTFIVLNMLICSTFASNGQIAQLLERGANNGKVLCSRILRTRIHFSYGLLSLFKYFAYIHYIKSVNLFYVCIAWSDSSVGRAWC